MRQKSSHIKFCILKCSGWTEDVFVQKKWWRHHVPRKSQRKDKSRKDTAVAISIKANHYVCGLQPIGSQLYDTRKVTLQYLTISGSQKSILKERPLELPILCVFSIKDLSANACPQVIVSEMVGSSNFESKSIRPKVIPKTTTQTSPGLATTDPVFASQCTLLRRPVPFHSYLPMPLQQESHRIPWNCCFAPR